MINHNFKRIGADAIAALPSGAKIVQAVEYAETMTSIAQELARGLGEFDGYSAEAMRGYALAVLDVERKAGDAWMTVAERLVVVAVAATGVPAQEQ